MTAETTIKAEASAQIGHNNPPSNAELLAEVLDDLPETLIEMNEALTGKIRLIEDYVVDMKAECADQADADLCVDVIRRIQAAAKNLEDARTTTKAPFLNAGRTVDEFFKPLTGRIAKARAMAESPLLAWQKKLREQERAEALRLQQKAEAEASARLAAAAALENAGKSAEAEKKMDSAVRMEERGSRFADLATTGTGMGVTRTEDGNTASLAKRWIGRVVDRNILDVTALLPFLTEEALASAANKLAQGYALALKSSSTIPVPVIRGMLIEQVESVRVR